MRTGCWNQSEIENNTGIISNKYTSKERAPVVKKGFWTSPSPALLSPEDEDWASSQNVVF